MTDLRSLETTPFNSKEVRAGHPDLSQSPYAVLGHYCNLVNLFVALKVWAVFLCFCLITDIYVAVRASVRGAVPAATSGITAVVATYLFDHVFYRWASAPPTLEVQTWRSQLCGASFQFGAPKLLALVMR